MYVSHWYVNILGNSIIDKILIFIASLLCAICSFFTKDRETQCKSRYDSIKADGEVIHSLVKENLGYFMVRLVNK